MTGTELDWTALDRLRDGFLRGASAAGPYWNSPEDLASYDFTFGERIGWKGDQVLRELLLRGWRPTSRSVFDWGWRGGAGRPPGGGVWVGGWGGGPPARRTIPALAVEIFDGLTVWADSPLASDF